ncbi:MAG TPA: translation elongation factor Ts [Thermodesulfobium narugense]|uniref:Elongation factor Ts n=1 Tax=Thermodesulfobium acidiphilum TaxID=1794699 RepID=A0A2R4W1H8_THEAF|nr:translation elongation factor Ts [Thermodesulfobium acidiphilum]AWB10661.1 elongation factor Ts [Thermodesulfobium acidiphilum]PMP85278.1 MAG: elongation factor Ts [Thermodesulfobium narugense]HEM55355.1 translation elongation factor Ts [Thermodesulfobium narugense]
MEIKSEIVKELRERTGAGIMDCKKALQECSCDMEKAIKYLREKGLAKAAKRAGKEAKEGIIEAYIHQNKKIGVLLELNCETDFVARTDEFLNLAHDIALQIAASNPIYISKEHVSEEVLNSEKEILKNQARQEGKPENMLDKIVEGKIKKFYEEVCLLEQPFVKDPSIKISDLINQMIAKVGENIVVRRFSRFSLGESV